MDNQPAKSKNHFLGSGWGFPVTFVAGYNKLHITENEENINDSIAIILQTRQGERFLNPFFGAGVQKFFLKMDDTLKGEISDAVKTSLMLYEPRIKVLEVKIEYSDNYNGLVEIMISYLYNQTNTRHNYVFPFHIKEGTNLVK
ncbi:MAG: GPW/gp25 family protein [Chitinophagaceae bacterium]|nr:GPW/gp25 family protein [Chitinophagaceae bacterium]